MSNIEVVLYNPEIPQNTGNIMRTCVALGLKLHLIEPMGFKIDDTKLRRSAVDYYDKINYEIHSSFNEFSKKNQGIYYFLTRYGNKNYTNINFNVDDKIYVIFGSESYGIDRSLLAENIDNCFRIPTTKDVRSLNLSNSAAIVLYEGMRQKGFPELEFNEPESLKGKDFLKSYVK
ncbi:tRNA (cytidine(34)-2'-O)-methyltransferase [Haploplasma modicum]|uniref:tRNA (cytidine(34)-2'-O)-methyltransferase n=1 Tax=Haploplasma modicum TaxID=2150 RepID=UPI00047C2BA5|nr:tRNA (cytidine(34)-2'-O)-methyltransferase [Haploplasma modicum]